MIHAFHLFDMISPIAVPLKTESQYSVPTEEQRISKGDAPIEDSKAVGKQQLALEPDNTFLSGPYLLSRDLG